MCIYNVCMYIYIYIYIYISVPSGKLHVAHATLRPAVAEATQEVAADEVAGVARVAAHLLQGGRAARPKPQELFNQSTFDVLNVTTYEIHTKQFLSTAS